MPAPASKEHARRVSAWINLLASPVLAALLAVVAPLAGFWVVFNHAAISSELRQLLPELPPSLAEDRYLHVAVLVALLLFLVVGWAAHKWAEGKRAQARQAELVATQIKLEQSVDRFVTLGLRRGLPAFRAAVTDSYSLVLLALGGAADDKAKLGVQIQFLLGNVGLFARALDLDGGAHRYTCSLLFYRPNEELSDATRAALTAPGTFFFRDLLPFASGQSRGLLEFTPRLSRVVAAGADEGAPDATSKPFTLPVPLTWKDRIDGDERYLALPGAPYSAASGEMAHFVSIDAVKSEWLDKRSALGPAVHKRLLEFFESEGFGAGIRSFVTVPIYSGDNTGQRKLEGVLTVQRNTPGLLEAEGQDGAFLALGTPFWSFLGTLAAAYRLKA